jgi:hypothetical protein
MAWVHDADRDRNLLQRDAAMEQRPPGDEDPMAAGSLPFSWST